MTNARMLLATFGALAASMDPIDPPRDVDWFADGVARPVIPPAELHNPAGSCDPHVRAARREKQRAARKLRKARGRR